MRTIMLVTRQPDLAQLVPELERGGLSATLLTPERLAQVADERHPDALLLDMRGMPPQASQLLVSEYVERSVVIVAIIDLEGLAQVTGDTPLDDFFVAGGDARELTGRVLRALWRRHGVDAENTVQVGALHLDLSNYKVTVAGDPVVMTFKEYELLRFLAMNAGQVFTREQLLNRVWGYDYFGGARTVDVHIRRIRAKIEVHGHELIETVRNVGYRLVAERPAKPVD